MRPVFSASLSGTGLERTGCPRLPGARSSARIGRGNSPCHSRWLRLLLLHLLGRRRPRPTRLRAVVVAGAAGQSYYPGGCGFGLPKQGTVGPVGRATEHRRRPAAMPPADSSRSSSGLRTTSPPCAMVRDDPWSRWVSRGLVTMRDRLTRWRVPVCLGTPPGSPAARGRVHGEAFRAHKRTDPPSRVAAELRGKPGGARGKKNRASSLGTPWSRGGGEERTPALSGRAERKKKDGKETRGGGGLDPCSPTGHTHTHTHTGTGDREGKSHRPQGARRSQA